MHSLTKVTAEHERSCHELAIDIECNINPNFIALEETNLVYDRSVLTVKEILVKSLVLLKKVLNCVMRGITFSEYTFVYVYA